MKYIINTDGASRGNPGPSSYGFLVRTEEGRVLYQEGKAIGISTNNVAEYTAVLKALEYLAKKTKDSSCDVEVFADSQLIVRQLSGAYKIKNPKLMQLFDQIKVIEFELGAASYKFIPREENFLADRLANIALDRG